ncbi:hypothetical protein LOZ80_12920 [Paenibacillus sp. HWE-109]|uniref:hypothetical protein n=1 Tax=Paenibacillus sp. HWE-109 TaxID=1306526 RepID=UPI001EDD9D17|nr:hypothetical protein [Paenibacillus sp. HWE-109]UKS29776.1 hypothetical protein LOZ80_12920 [Paenibacillus sp. HWE-109]
MTASLAYLSVLEDEAKWLPLLKQAVQDNHRHYNEEISMIRKPFTSPGYHTTIKQADYVHPIRDSLDYALAILDSGDEHYLERAWSILEQIVSLQDQDPLSPTFGIWSWFWEEPLAQMAPPDWNWADFIGKRLLLLLIRHGADVPEALFQRTEQAIRNSCEAIIKRNVGPDYTNIAIMGAFVTVIAGEWFDIPFYREYGLQRLKKLYDYSMQTGAFLEYNSPTYSTVAILELSALATYTRSEEARYWSKGLIDVTWQMISERFHPVFKQWSGPQARSYHTFLASHHLSFLHMACDGKLPFVNEDEFVYDPEWYGHGLSCPERFYRLFTDVDIRELTKELPPYQEFRTRTASTYMTPSFTLGTFNHNVMWNQCRNLLAYMRTADGDAAYMRLRLLHDGYDFCSAVFKSEQKNGDVLFGIQFALDGGDTHVNLDPANGRISATDLRIRFEIGTVSPARKPEWRKLAEDAFQMSLEETTLSIRALYGAMSGLDSFHWEITEDESTTNLDYVLYNGVRTDINFHAMQEAVLLFAVSFSAKGKILPESTVRTSSETILASLDAGEKQLLISIAKKPDLKSVLLHN